MAKGNQKETVATCLCGFQPKQRSSKDSPKTVLKMGIGPVLGANLRAFRLEPHGTTSLRHLKHKTRLGTNFYVAMVDGNKTPHRCYQSGPPGLLSCKIHPFPQQKTSHSGQHVRVDAPLGNQSEELKTISPFKGPNQNRQRR